MAVGVNKVIKLDQGLHMIIFRGLVASNTSGVDRRQLVDLRLLKALVNVVCYTKTNSIDLWGWQTLLIHLRALFFDF